MKTSVRQHNRRNVPVASQSLIPLALDSSKSSVTDVHMLSFLSKDEDAGRFLDQKTKAEQDVIRNLDNCNEAIAKHCCNYFSVTITLHLERKKLLLKQSGKVWSAMICLATTALVQYQQCRRCCPRSPLLHRLHFRQRWFLNRLPRNLYRLPRTE